MDEVTTVHGLVLEKIQEREEERAVVFDDGESTVSLTYKQLHCTVLKLAARLRKHSIEKEVVGLMLNSSVFSPAACLGVMSVPAAYLPIDPQVPSALLQHLIKTLHIRCIITQEALLQKLKDVVDIEVLQIEHCNETDMMFVHLATKPESYRQLLAYVITTSGTTGNPKIVRVTHSCIQPNITDIRSMYGVTAGDIVFQASPLTFDPSVVEMFTALSHGATLLLVPELLKMIPSRLTQIISTRQMVTILQATPALIRSFGEDFIRNKLLGPRSPLRILAFGGEACPDMATLRQWKHKNNTTELYNLYGITEVSCWATMQNVTAIDIQEKISTDDTVSLGKPLQNTILEVRSQDDKLVTEGEGQLFIGGPGRTCVINDEQVGDMNETKFRASGDLVRKAGNGMLFYLGRIDNQIKRHGKRINLTQIEQVALACKEVEDAVALYSEETQVLTLCIKVSNALVNKTSIDGTSRHLRDNLPHYVLPDQIIPIENIPITKHGKVDKRKVLQMIKTYSDSYPDNNIPYTEDGIWTFYKNNLQVVLGHSDIAKDQSFLKIGGDSFKALKLLGHIERELNLYDVRLLESILKDTFSNTCSLLLKVTKEFDRSSKRYTDSLKRKHSQLPNNVDRKVLILENTFDTNQGITCAKCGRGFVMKQNAVGSNNSVAISRGSRYYFTCKEISAVSNNMHIGNTNTTLESGEPRDRNDTDFQMEFLWKYDTRKCVDASPLIVSYDLNNGTVYVGSHSHRFSAVDLTSGRCIWETTLGGRVESSACLSKCQKFVIVGCYDSNVYVLNVTDGKIHCKYQTGDLVKSSPALDVKTGFVYIGSHDHHVYSLDIQQNARCVWKRDIDDSSIFSSPIVHHGPDIVYTATLGGRVAALQPDTGNIIWQHKLGKPVFSSPSTTERNIFIASVDHIVYCFSHDGQQIWRFQTGDHMFSSPVPFRFAPVGAAPTNKQDQEAASPEPGGTTAVTKQTSWSERILIGSHDHYVYCLDTNGQFIWKHEMNSPVYATPFIFGTGSCNTCSKQDTRSRNRTMMNQYAVICSTTGQVRLVDALSGELVTSIDVPGEVFSSPIVCDNKVIIGCRDDNVYCFQITFESKLE